MNHTQGHKANDVFALRGAWQSDASASKKCLGYEPFGSLLPGRNYSSSNYNFGFNGQEKDDEVFGSTGTSYTAEFWQYDPRAGRRWNMDPVDKPWMSPYHVFSNNPVAKIDPNGANDDWVEGADGDVYWNDDVTSADDDDLKEGETYRGTEYRRFEDVGSTTYNDVRYNADKTITSTKQVRPDADGVVTQPESIDWYHFGGGRPLTVDISRFNFASSRLSMEDFRTNAQSVDFFNRWHNHPGNDAIIWRPASDETLSDVYGTIRLAVVDRARGTIRVVTDDQGFFDRFDYSALGAIVGDRLRSHGNPTPYGFRGTGTATIRLEAPPTILDRAADKARRLIEEGRRLIPR